MDVLQALTTAIPYFHQAFKEDVTIGLVDREKYLAFLSGKTVNLANKPGAPIAKGNVGMQSALRGESFSGYYPPEVFGVPFYSINIPIRDDSGEVIGALGIGYNIENQVNMETTMENIERIMGQAQDHLHSITAHAEELAMTIDDFTSNCKNAQESTMRSNDILNVIANISAQTNLIGLNAAIEAAHAGEHGKSFSVVADEVRKLARESAHAANQVKELLSGIQKEMSDITKGIEDIRTASGAQVMFVEDFSKMFEEIYSISKTMDAYIRKIF